MKKSIIIALIVLMAAVFILQKLQKPAPVSKVNTPKNETQEIGVKLPEISTETYQVTMVKPQTQPSSPISPQYQYIPSPPQPVIENQPGCEIKNIKDILKDYGKNWAYDSKSLPNKETEYATFDANENQIIGNSIILYYTCRSLASNSFEKALEKYENLNDDYKVFYLQTKYSTLKQETISQCQQEIEMINAFKNDPAVLKNNICSSYCDKDLNGKCSKLINIGFEQKDCKTTYPKSQADCDADPDNKFWCLLTYYLGNAFSKNIDCPFTINGILGVNSFCNGVITKKISLCDEIEKQLVGWYCYRKRELTEVKEIKKLEKKLAETRGMPPEIKKNLKNIKEENKEEK